MSDGFDAPSSLGRQHRLGYVRPMAEYETTGKKRDRDLHFVVANGVPDSTTTTSASAVVKAPTPRQPSVWYDACGTCDVYEVPEDGFSMSVIGHGNCDAVLLFDPEELGLHIKKGTPYMTLAVKNTDQAIREAGLSGTDLALDLRCDPEGKFILVCMEYRDHDCSEGQRRLPINELAWQTFRFAAGANTRNLQVIIVCDVWNTGFHRVLEHAHKDTLRPVDKPAIWTRDDEPHFWRLLGTETVSGKVLQLTNHHHAVGNKRIAKIMTASCFVKNCLDKENGELTAALVLEPIPEAELARLRRR